MSDYKSTEVILAVDAVHQCELLDIGLGAGGRGKGMHLLTGLV